MDYLKGGLIDAARLLLASEYFVLCVVRFGHIEEICHNTLHSLYTKLQAASEKMMSGGKLIL